MDFRDLKITNIQEDKFKTVYIGTEAVKRSKCFVHVTEGETMLEFFKKIQSELKKLYLSKECLSELLEQVITMIHLNKNVEKSKCDMFQNRFEEQRVELLKLIGKRRNQDEKRLGEIKREVVGICDDIIVGNDLYF